MCIKNTVWLTNSETELQYVDGVFTDHELHERIQKSRVVYQVVRRNFQCLQN